MCVVRRRYRQTRWRTCLVVQGNVASLSCCLLLASFSATGNSFLIVIVIYPQSQKVFIPCGAKKLHRIIFLKQLKIHLVYLIADDNGERKRDNVASVSCTHYCWLPVLDSRRPYSKTVSFINSQVCVKLCNKRWLELVVYCGVVFPFAWHRFCLLTRGRTHQA